MSFVQRFNALPEEKSRLLRRFESLLEPKYPLEALASESQQLTRQYFGRTMRLFAPLYISNECVNICKYCGFSRNNPIFRVTLSVEEVQKEARHLVSEGFRNILLVAGEHPKFVSNHYLEDCVKALRDLVPSVSLEVGPMEEEEYVPIVKAGAEGLVVYQETYHRPTYAEMHKAGPKKHFDWRLECPERAYAAGFRRLGIGALFGLWDWKDEALALAAHIEYLLKHCWKASFTLSFPRLKPAAGSFEPEYPISDSDFVRMICAFRVCFPQVGLVL
ncbi:MAG: radical SAM protein, partial [Verrucomicrobiota bacterium]